MDEKLISAKDISERCKVNLFTVYSWARRGIIPSIRLGPKLIRFSARSIEEFITEKKTQEPPGHGKSAD